MSSSIREFVLNHPIFCHHNHHISLKDFDAGRPDYDYRTMLGYAEGDLMAAAGARPAETPDDAARIAALWPKIRATGYGRAVTLACQHLFSLDYSPEYFPRITEALQAAISGKTAVEVFDYFVKGKANTKWVLQDGFVYVNDPAGLREGLYPDYYRAAWRMDLLFSMTDAQPIKELETATGFSIFTLDSFVEAINASITKHAVSSKLAALKNGMAYQRDLVVGDPTHHEAELAFNKICSRKTFYDGIQQENGAVNAHESRMLGDYLFHKLIQRANDEDIPVQIHTGFLAHNWGSLNGAKASHLIPIFDKYRRVRFDLFHASWPWTSELGAIAKSYPNVYPDLCWAWTMNPAESERALSEWLDGIPFNKIFGYGADMFYPWHDMGYAMQARIGIARVLEQKIEAGYFSPQTAEEVAEAIMLRNGEEFFGLG